MILAQPLESCVAIILPDARPGLGNLRLTHRGLTSCRSLADGLARCQLSSAGGVAARQIVERSPLHCWERGRAKPRAVTVFAKFFPIQVMARGSKHWISQRLRNDVPDCPNRMIWDYFWVAPMEGRNWEAPKD